VKGERAKVNMKLWEAGGMRALLFLTVISAALNVALGLEIRRLRAVAQPTPLEIGQELGPLEVFDVKGTAVTLRFDDVPVPTVLYVLKPECVWCARNAANLKSLIGQQQGRFRVLLISTDEGGIAAYREKEHLSDPIYYVSPTSQRAYRLFGTPKTLLVSSQSKLLQNWEGAYLPKLQTEIERALNLKLPGLVQEAQASPPEAGK